MATPNRGSVGGRGGSSQSNGSPRTPVKRAQSDYSQSPAAKSARASPATPSRASPSTSSSLPGSGQPKVVTLQEVKRITSSAFSNNLSFIARVVKLEPRRIHWDKRVQYHRQKVLFADSSAYLIAFMHSDIDEEEDDPKLVEGFTSIVTNFRVVRKGEILLHERTKAGM